MSMGKRSQEQKPDGRATGRAACTEGARGTGARRGVRERVRAWWRNLPLMRSFFCYAAVCLVLATVASVLAIDLLMEAYYRVDAATNSERIEVNGGPYIYDAATDELVPATDMGLNSMDQMVFVGFTDASGVRQGVETIIAGGWNAGVHVGYATMDMVREDPALTIYDWGGNYTEADYIASNGSPYPEDEDIDADDLPAYDARERAERVRTDLSLNAGNLGEGVVVSNVAYYVSQDDNAYETPLATLIRALAGLTPFILYGGFAILLFRRFYRSRLAEPLASLQGAVDRISAQDLDFTVDAVAGRELSALAAAFEKMRASLAAAQRRLWRTAEERRRLNAAFAHDLRTPVTVLKGTVEMARMRAERGEALRDDAIDTIARQVDRLESYAVAMSGIAKLEDRKVDRVPVAVTELAQALVVQSREYVDAKRPDVALEFDAACAAGERTVSVDRSLIEEVLGNLLSNACGHARGRIAVLMSLERGDAGDGAASPRAEGSPDGADADADALPAHGPSLMLRVSDDGSGFTDEALHRACEPFYGESRSAEHVGLGLNIVRTLVRLHGGTVELSNAPTGGAVVTVTFEVSDHDR